MRPPRRYAFSAAAAAVALLAALAGCSCLPDGEPPEGNLTSNRQPPVTTPLALRNHLATQLIVFALQHGVAQLDPGSDPETVAIAADAARTAGFRLERGAPLRLRLERSSDGSATLVATESPSYAEVWRSERP